MQGHAFSKRQFGTEHLGSIDIFSVTSPGAAASSSFAVSPGEVEVPEGVRRGLPGAVLTQPRPLPLSLLALIPTAQMENEMVVHLREEGALTGAVETAEGVVKPQVNVQFSEGGRDRGQTLPVFVKDPSAAVGGRRRTRDRHQQPVGVPRQKQDRNADHRGRRRSGRLDGFASYLVGG